MEIKTLKDKERELIREVLAKTEGDLEKTARLLQVPLSEVKKKIRAHGIETTLHQPLDNNQRRDKK